MYNIENYIFAIMTELIPRLTSQPLLNMLLDTKNMDNDIIKPLLWHTV